MEVLTLKKINLCQDDKNQETPTEKEKYAVMTDISGGGGRK